MHAFGSLTRSKVCHSNCWYFTEVGGNPDVANAIDGIAARYSVRQVLAFALQKSKFSQVRLISIGEETG